MTGLLPYSDFVYFYDGLLFLNLDQITFTSTGLASDPTTHQKLAYPNTQITILCTMLYTETINS